MKQIEAKNKKNVLVSSFAKFFRVGILSLFVMLVIPSISSGIFGNGDAKAGCLSISNAAPNATITPAVAATAAFCGPNSDACIRTITDVDGQVQCTQGLADCPTISNNFEMRCSSLNRKNQCEAVNSTCVWTVEDVNNNKLVDAVCRVYQIATGTAGKAFAAVGVISVGIGFFTGKVSWGLMISVAAGIAVFFGAPSIIAVISGDQSATALCSNVAS
tara:strand:+ start:547 stop:1197 length:651 start_codon:yes stop_codon:yes gene_type:complete